MIEVLISEQAVSKKFSTNFSGSAEIYYFFGKISEPTEMTINVFQSIIGEYPGFDLQNHEPEKLVEKFFEIACSEINTSIMLDEQF